MAEKARDILEMIWNFPRFFRVFSPAGGIFRNSEPVWCPHSFLCLLFPGKGKRTAFSFCFSKKKTSGKRKETGETFRMVSPDPFYRPEPCSGLAAYGSRESTIDFVGADAERSCSRRRSVTDAACPLRVLIGPILRFCTARSFMGVGADDSVRPYKAYP